MDYNREYELSLQRRLNGINQNVPPPRNNSKKSKRKKIALIILYSLACIVAVTGIGFGIYYIVKFAKNSNDNDSEILFAPNTNLSNVKNSDEILINSTYSVSLKYYNNNDSSMYSSYGTAWSFGYCNDSWYLLTNFHVVREYLYYHHAYDPLNNRIISPYKVQNINSFELKKYINNKLCNINNNFSQNKNNSTEEYSVNIITDNNDDDIKLFSDGNKYTSNFYTLDMAMIQIKDNINSNKIKNYIDKNQINLPYNNWLENKSNLVSNLNNIDSYLIGGFPVFRTQPNKYYFETSLNKNDLNLTQNYWNDEIYPHISGSSVGDGNFSYLYTIKQRGNVIISESPFKEGENDDEWNLVSGASGSPVFPISSIENNQIELNNVPVGIYWGGLGSQDENDLIKPGFTAFVSNTRGCEYNIYENFKEYLQQSNF